MLKLIGTTIVAALTVLSIPAAHAAEPVKLPVIVVLKENANIANFRGVPQLQLDARMQASPDLWNYLDAGVTGMVASLEQRIQFKAKHVYSKALRGFAASLSAQQIAALEADPAVDYVEVDGPMNTTAQTLPWGVNKVDADVSSTRAGDGQGVVANVTVYVIDTGVGPLMESRQRPFDLKLTRRVNTSSSNSIIYDCNGHGSHVAGTVAAYDNQSDVVGIAPGVDVVSVRVLGCDGSGSTSDVIKGIDWVTANAKKPAVANMSLGGGVQFSLDEAVRRSVASGVFYALAAGNSGADACQHSPARAGAGTDNGIMTSGATDGDDTAASFSNYGPCVDVWAPGVDILSLKKKTGTRLLSGTSMASPHTAGAAALYLSRNPNASPAQVEAALRNAAAAPGTSAPDGTAIRRLNVSGF